MDYIYNLIQDRPILTWSAIAVTLYCSTRLLKAVAKRWFKNLFSALDQRPKHYEDGIVYLHEFPRRTARQHLNVSPFAIKVETWLRFHKIPYKAVETMKMSSKTQQIPYIILDGEEIADSNIIMQYLEKKFNLPESEGLSNEQEAVSHSLLRMVDESLSWTYFTLRYMHFGEFYGKYFQLPLPKIFRNMVYKTMKKRTSHKLILHGMGRKTIPEIADIGSADIQAISKYLGTKNFLMGDKITKVDCAVFAHLSQIVYVGLDYPYKEAMKNCPNILPYMERIKKDLWPDWDELVNMELFT